MQRNSAGIGALVFVFALAGCAEVTPTTPGETSLVALGAAPVQVSHGNGPFRVEWSVNGPGRIGGRIYNDYQDGAYALQLLVQGLDASNHVVNQSYLWVGGDIGPLDNRSFMLTKVRLADHYWITIHSYQILERP